MGIESRRLVAQRATMAQLIAERVTDAAGGRFLRQMHDFMNVRAPAVSSYELDTVRQQVTRHQLQWVLDFVRNKIEQFATHSTQLQQFMSAMRTETTRLAAVLSGEQPPTPSIPLAQIVESLRGLEKNFPEVKYSTRYKTISVVTRLISLNDDGDDGDDEGSPIELGDFRITLRLGKLPDYFAHGNHGPEEHSAFYIHALHPRQVGGLTHPHVKDGILCEGEARTHLLATISQGLVFEFFKIIEATLSTYNSASPYQSLDAWRNADDDDDSGHGDYNCATCDNELSEDEVYTCRACGNQFCQDCSVMCENSGRAICLNCLDRMRRRRLAECCQHPTDGCPVYDHDIHTETPAPRRTEAAATRPPAPAQVCSACRRTVATRACPRAAMLHRVLCDDCVAAHRHNGTACVLDGGRACPANRAVGCLLLEAPRTASDVTPVVRAVETR